MGLTAAKEALELVRKRVASFQLTLTDENMTVFNPAWVQQRKDVGVKTVKKEYVYQCRHCLSVYDESAGDPANGITSGTAFGKLPEGYNCFLCEAPSEDFVKIEKSSLELKAV